MSISIIPAVPGTYAIRRRPASGVVPAYEYRDPIVAWEIYSDHDEENLGVLNVTPIGVDGRIFNVLRIIHG